MTINENQPGEDIAQLMAVHQQRLSGYIRHLIPNRADAEDVLQEVNLFIWRHGGEFIQGSNFGAWAYQIARIRVLNFYKKRPLAAVRFSDAVLSQLAAGAPSGWPGERDFSPLRLDALEHCLQKLSEKDRELIRLRHDGNATVQSVAERSGRSLKGVYHSLNRIRTTLLECIQRTLTAEGR